MYYETMLIDGVLNLRTTPNGKFKPMTAEQLTNQLLESQRQCADLKAEKNVLLNALHRIQSVYDWEDDFAGDVAHNTLKAFDYSFNENGSIISE